MNRREFLTYASGAAVGAALPGVDKTFAQDLVPTGWRTFEVTTRVEVLKPTGSTRVWLPAALLGETPFQKTLANEFKAEGVKAKLVDGKADALGIVVAEFPAGAKPAVTLTSRIATRNYAVDLSKPSKPLKESLAELEYFLRPTKQLPTDGIVKMTADKINYCTYQEIADRFPEISSDEFNRSLVFIQPDGTAFFAAEAVYRSLAYKRSRESLAWSYDHVPGFAVVSETGYNLIARHRKFA